MIRAMSLATRCPACHTAFRVVQDQLKVSEGWVRCGRCNEVFNALEGLFDLERDGMPAQPPAPPASQGGGGTLPPAPEPAADDTPHPQTEFLKQPEAPAPTPAPPEPPAAPVAPPLEEEDDDAGDTPQTAYEVLDSRFLDRSTYAPSRLPEPEPEAEFLDARYDSSFQADAQALESGLPVQAANTDGEADGDGAKRKVRSASGSPDDPEFLRRADRQARWASPPVRRALATAAVLLALLLAGQVALHQRDWLAAHHPATAPWLAQACDWLGCEVGPLRSIDDVTIDSSSLARTGQTGTYRLTVALRNRAGVAVAMPAIDLTLTDTNGDRVARRVLQRQDFGAPAALSARGEVTLTLDLETPGHRIAGYTVEAFYP